MDITPKLIMPFKLSKEDAKNAYIAKVKGARLSELKFRNEENLEGFKRVYIPYWVCRARTNGNISLSGTESHANGSRDVTNVYNISLNIAAEYNGMSFPATTALEKDRAMELAPFPTASYLAYDELYTKDALVLPFVTEADEFRKEALKIISDNIFEQIGNTDALSQFTVHALKGQTFVDSLPNLSVEMVPALLPVWVLTFHSLNRVSYALVNGVTGKVSADLPVNIGKFTIGAALGTIPFIFIMWQFKNFSASTWMWICACLSMAVSSVYIANASALAKRSGYKRQKKNSGKVRFSLREKILKLFDTATNIDKEQNAKNFFFYFGIAMLTLLLFAVLAVFSVWLIPLIGTLVGIFNLIHKMRPRFMPMYIVELSSMLFAMGIYLSEPADDRIYLIGCFVLNIVAIASLFVETFQFNLLATTPESKAKLCELTENEGKEATDVESGT
jgi:hypothetical protein